MFFPPAGGSTAGLCSWSSPAGTAGDRTRVLPSLSRGGRDEDRHAFLERTVSKDGVSDVAHHGFSERETALHATSKVTQSQETLRFLKISCNIQFLSYDNMPVGENIPFGRFEFKTAERHLAGRFRLTPCWGCDNCPESRLRAKATGGQQARHPAAPRRKPEPTDPVLHSCSEGGVSTATSPPSSPSSSTTASGLGFRLACAIRGHYRRRLPCRQTTQEHIRLDTGLCCVLGCVCMCVVGVCVCESAAEMPCLPLSNPTPAGWSRPQAPPPRPSATSSGRSSAF